MKYKKFPVLVWFLADDMHASASMLTDKLLKKTINGCMQCMLAARFYSVGIRSQKFYAYYFSKERKVESIEKFFPLWPLSIKPPFQGYNSKEGKWCRRCYEHYKHISDYLDVLVEEHLYRFGKEHSTAKFAEWSKYDAPQLKIPYGNLKKLTLPWKVIAPKYRRADIIQGYRLQYQHYLESTDDMKLSSFTKRDVPAFLVPNGSKWMQ